MMVNQRACGSPPVREPSCAIKHAIVVIYQGACGSPPAKSLIPMVANLFNTIGYDLVSGVSRPDPNFPFISFCVLSFV